MATITKMFRIDGLILEINFNNFGDHVSQIILRKNGDSNKHPTTWSLYTIILRKYPTIKNAILTLEFLK